MSKNTAIDKEVKTEIKEDVILEKIQDAYDSLIAQVQQFNKDEIHAGTMKTKALGAIEVLVQIHPKLQEQKSDS